MRKYIAFLSLTVIVLLLFSSCTKEVHEDVYEDLVIDDNQPPPFDGVSTVELNTYVNKLYVDLIGRSPSEAELDQATQQLRDGEFTTAAKEAVITPLIESKAYYDRFFEVTTQKLLQGADSFQIAQEATNLYFAVDLVLSQGDTLIGYTLQLELDKLVALLDVKAEYRNGDITVNEFMRRMIMNQFYDQINMGSLNYVVSCFENLFHRQPTEQELSLIHI